MLIGLKDNKDKQSLVVYEGEIVPHMGEMVYFPHKGKFKVIEVTYCISDDYTGKDRYGSMMWASLSVERIE